MMANIIIKGKTSMGKTRSEQETNMRKEWGHTMDDGQLDKIKFLEKKTTEKTGGKKVFVHLHKIEDMVK